MVVRVEGDRRTAGLAADVRGDGQADVSCRGGCRGSKRDVAGWSEEQSLGSISGLKLQRTSGKALLERETEMERYREG